MKPFHKKLAAYSAMAACLFSAEEKLAAQAVYVDIEPDFVLDEHLEWFYLDMDINGINDFQFFNISYLYDSTYYDGPEFRQIIWGGIQNTLQNAIAANHAYFTIGPGIDYPYVINEGSLINKDLNFQYWFDQILALRQYSSVEISGETFFLTGEAGHWFPYYPIENKYLGIKFKAEDEKMHFGWIRCSIIDEHEEGLTLIIKDYAYESKPNVPIIAGDTIGDTTKFVLEAEDLKELHAHIYSFQKTIYCIINHEDINAELFIYSISGEKIVTQKLTAEKTEIDFSKYAAGIYVVEIISGEHTFLKKVWVE